MGEPNEADVLARAKRTFIEKNRDDRAWDAGFSDREARQGTSSPAERSDRGKVRRKGGE